MTATLTLGPDQTISIGDNPSLGNNVDSGLGNLSSYIKTRFPSAGVSNNQLRKALEVHRRKYDNLFLDINQNSQALIAKIVP